MVVLSDYQAALEAAGDAAVRGWPYAWERFADGLPVPGLARELYRGLGDAAVGLGDPFAAGPTGHFRRWLAEPEGGDRPPRLWLALHQQREDLRRAFPDPVGRDREAFLDWVYGGGARAREAGIEVALAPRRPARGGGSVA
jgi:hypothetical protein